MRNFHYISHTIQPLFLLSFVVRVKTEVGFVRCVLYECLPGYLITLLLFRNFSPLFFQRNDEKNESEENECFRQHYFLGSL